MHYRETDFGYMKSLKDKTFTAKRYRPFCSSRRCCGQSDGKTFSKFAMKDVPNSCTVCPDCGEALIWRMVK